MTQRLLLYQLEGLSTAVDTEKIKYGRCVLGQIPVGATGGMGERAGCGRR